MSTRITLRQYTQNKLHVAIYNTNFASHKHLVLGRNSVEIGRGKFEDDNLK